MARVRRGSAAAGLLSALLIGAACSSTDGSDAAVDHAQTVTTSVNDGGRTVAAEPIGSTTDSTDHTELSPLPAGCDHTSASGELRIGLRHSSSQLITPNPVHVLEGIQLYLENSSAARAIHEVVVFDADAPLESDDLDGLALMVDYDQIASDEPTSVLEAIERSCVPLLVVIPQPPYLNSGTPWVLPSLVPGRPGLAELVAAQAATYKSVGLITGTGSSGITDLLAERLSEAIVVEAEGSAVGLSADQPPPTGVIEELVANEPDLLIIDSLCKANGQALLAAGYSGPIWYLLPDCIELVVFEAETPAGDDSWLVGPSIIDQSFDSPFKQAGVAALDEQELDQRTGLIGWNIGWYVEQLLQPIAGVVTPQTVLTRAHSINTRHPHLSADLMTSADADAVINELFWHTLDNKQWRYDSDGPSAP